MKKDLRAGFAQIDKTYAYAKVDTKLNVRESGSTSARIVGTLPAKALCFVIADADQEWVYIESGDVRGFVRTDYLQQGKEALEYVTSTGEDQMKLADQIIDPSENEAFNYKKETVYEVKTSTGNGIITFAKQFVGRPYVLEPRLQASMKRVQAMSSAITAMSHCTTAREKSWRH